MSGWNFADLWERIAERFPDSDAIVQGNRRILWREFNERSNGVANYLLAKGAQHGDKVALYVYNAPEYMEGCFAAFKAGLVPINTNYRYLDDELVYLWTNADAVAVVFHGSFADRIEGIRDQLPLVKHWLWVDDGSGPKPDWAVDYQEIASANTEPAIGPWGRSGDDLLMIYTGGTTGMPKGVMWRQDDIIRAVIGIANFRYHEDPAVIGNTAPVDELEGPGTPGLPACPLMHGSGWYTANLYLTNAGSVVLLEDRKFNVEEMLDVIEREKVAALTIVGDAFARPMVQALDAEPDRWDISSLAIVASSGTMWSEPIKEGMLAHQPNMLLLDSFSSSEAIGFGSSISSGESAQETAKFNVGTNAILIADDGSLVEAGSGVPGRIAIPGNVPLGYYKDEKKTAETFIQRDGVRYSMPGDYALLEADGTLTLLGRGSVCINTGGEKVFPEEVEEVLKNHPQIEDAVVVGVPDDKFGQAVTAVVELSDTSAAVGADEVISFVKEHLSSYKAPKHVVIRDSIHRAPNGKVDYKGTLAYALEQLEIPA